MYPALVADLPGCLEAIAETKLALLDGRATTTAQCSPGGGFREVLEANRLNLSHRGNLYTNFWTNFAGGACNHACPLSPCIRNNSGESVRTGLGSGKPVFWMTMAECPCVSRPTHGSKEPPRGFSSKDTRTPPPRSNSSCEGRGGPRRNCTSRTAGAFQSGGWYFRRARLSDRLSLINSAFGGGEDPDIAELRCGELGRQCWSWSSIGEPLSSAWAPQAPPRCLSPRSSHSRSRTPCPWPWRSHPRPRSQTHRPATRRASSGPSWRRGPPCPPC